ncbi:MAG: glycosyltransferase family 4 protein [Candidatus Hodarchaeota archaeon]
MGGASTVIENLANQLGKKGVDVTIGALTFERIPPHGAYKVKTLPVYDISKLKRFIDGFDIVHNHHPVTNYLALINRKPFVYHYHGAPDYRKESLFRFNMLLSIHIMKHAFDAVISVSESGAGELKRYFGLNDIDVIYNGVDADRFKPGLDERFRKGTPQFLFVGNLYEHKKVEELILALKEVVKGYPKAHLQIVGEGYAYTLLDTLIRKLHFQDYVTLVGRVSDFDLPFYYASCDVYVTASRWELFGLPLLEAMACGKPVVASSIPPHVELLTESIAGTIFTEGDTEDLIKKAVKTYEESDKYRNNALQFARAHDWPIVADRVLRIYAQILND